MNEENYISRKQKLLKDFDKSVARIKSVLTSRYGAKTGPVDHLKPKSLTTKQILRFN